MYNLKNKNRKSIKSRKSRKSLKIRKSRKTIKSRKSRRSIKKRKTRKTRRARKTGGFRFKDESKVNYLLTSKDQNLSGYKRAEPSVVRINDYVCIKENALEDMTNLVYELFVRRLKDRTNSRDLHRAKSLSLTDFFKEK